MLLRETPNALHLPVLFFFFSFFCQPYPKYRRIRSKKIFYRHWTANAIRLFVPVKSIFFGSLLFQNKSQRREIPQRLLDKYGHVFISISLKRTLSNGQKPVYTLKNLVSEQIAFAAVLYFGQAFAFCRLINKRVLEWFLLIMCKPVPDLQTCLVETIPHILFLIKKRRSADADVHKWTVTLSN